MNNENLHLADDLLRLVAEQVIQDFVANTEEYILGERLERHYDPCPKCKGKNKSQCQCCRGRGWVRG